MTSIDLVIESQLQCAQCKRPERGPTVASGSRLYCSMNCLHTYLTHQQASEVLYFVEGNRGGSPLGIRTAKKLVAMIEKLKPLHDDPSTCPECWAIGSLPRIGDGEPGQATCPWGHAWTQ